MLTSFAFSAGLMLSPNTLTVVGNLAGRIPARFLFLLAAGALCHIVTSRVYVAALRPEPGPFAGETGLIRHALGPGHAIFFSFFPRLFMFLFLSTSVLVSAGYVFNEVFVIWFPNLGFSFCLLGFLLALNFVGKGAANLAQVFFISVSLLGLLVLIIAGFAGMESVAKEAPQVPFPGWDWGYLFFSVVIFMGFELSLFSSAGRKQAVSFPRAMVSAVLGIGLLLGTWGLLSLAHVSPERLAESTLPHAVAARVIMGQSGRVVMGMVVLSGSCAAVNGLLASVSRLLAAMARDGLIPPALVQVRGRPLIAPALLGGGVFAMMGTGLAGYPILEQLNIAGAWFWLGTYGAVHLAFQLTKRPVSILRPLSLASLLLIGFTMASVFFFLEGPDTLKVVKILIALLACSIGCTGIISRWKPDNKE